uniref:DUF1758 domain-containing protein n=1 Tax=Anopheles stephensi TaxID=30069 RepID=A0A182YRP2_ANOST
MNGSSVEELSRLVNETKRLVRGMEPIQSWDTPLTSLVTYKLDFIDSYNELIAFCEKQTNVLNSCTMRNQRSIVTKPAKVVRAMRIQNYSRQRKTYGAPPACAMQSSSANTTVYPECKADHMLDKCNNISALSQLQRRERMKEHRLCFNCLRRGHGIKFCRSRLRCEQCKRRYHTLLCDRSTSADSANTYILISATMQDNSQRTRKFIWLSTARVFVLNWNGEAVPARALSDMGAQSNFMSERLAQQLKLPRTRVQKHLYGVGSVALTASSTVTTTVKSLNALHSITVEFQVLSNVTADYPPQSVDVLQWNIPSDVVFADPGFNQRGKIDLLLGAEIFAELLEQGQLKLAPNLPKLFETKFGWIVSGKMEQKTPGHTTDYNLACCNATEDKFNTSMERLVSLENLPGEKIPSEDDIACLNQYEATTRQNEDGRYVVTLPKVSQISTLLGESKNITLRRFMAIERRMRVDKELNDAYKDFMLEYISLGHMSCIGPYKNVETKGSAPVYYLPHHAVWKAGSATTRCIVVFDASCKTSSGRSLNDVLRTTPQIQEDIVAIQLRFRMKNVASVANMYRQVLAEDSDRSLQRILWRADSEEPIKYDTSCALFLAIRSLQWIFEDHGENYSKVLACKEDFYVDDLLSGADSVEAARDTARQLYKLLGDSHFPLRKWSSNKREALQDIPAEMHATSNQLELATDLGSIATLGLLWNRSLDTLKVQVRQPTENAIKTKASVLSCIAKLYDPLGFLDLVKMGAKLIMQEIWKLKDADEQSWSWDKKWPESMKNGQHFCLI